MAKTPKVVPIAEETSKLIAQDEKTQRIILGIGSERIAIDRLVRITKLPPALVSCRGALYLIPVNDLDHGTIRVLRAGHG